MPQQSKADLHVHSKHSDRPSEWILRRVGSPESFTEPLEVYRKARQRGMDFVTLSDHNCIDGALEIAHLPGTFISNEVTTYFPEDGAKLHCLVTGITPGQFEIIQQVRENIYDFRQYLIEQDIIYSVAHPLFRVNERLGPDHVEKLLVMFNRFEGINGTRDPRAAELVRTIFRQITPELIARLADKHNLEPLGDEPWKKTFTGGSDDHGGVYIASAFTVTPKVETVEQYLQMLRDGRHEMAGISGTSLRLAHSFYHIAYSYYKHRIMDGSTAKMNLLGELFRNLLERPNQPAATPTFGQRARRFVSNIVRSRKMRSLTAVERLLVNDFSKLLDTHGRTKPAAAFAGDADANDERTFHLACNIAQQIGYDFASRFLEHLRQGNLIESLQNIASLGPVALSIAPYLAAMATQHKDEQFLQAVAQRFETSHHLTLRSDKRAWITDTFSDVNGVTRTVRAMAQAAADAGKPLTVVTCQTQEPEATFPLKNFKPIGEFTLPEYEQQMLAFPPFLEMIEYLERQRFSQLIISTPGPLGLTALAAGRLLGLQMVGIYHTDFPQYVRCLTEDAALERLTWRYMHWFYEQMDVILAPSQFYRRQLIDYGFEGSNIRVMRRGIDLARFNPDHGQRTFWHRHGLNASFKFLYVGRISAEKNIELLLSSFLELLRRGVDAQLAIVGEGPMLDELRRKYRDRRIVFTGVMRDEQLARAYASADAFAFPSTTDTFGNVVLEALASGLPAIVTDQGGPQEIARHMHCGIVVDITRPGAFTDAMQQLVQDTQLHRRLRHGALEMALSSNWSSVVEDLWQSSDVPHATAAEDWTRREPTLSRAAKMASA